MLLNGWILPTEELHCSLCSMHVSNYFVSRSDGQAYVLQILECFTQLLRIWSKTQNFGVQEFQENIILWRRHALMFEDGAFSHKIDDVAMWHRIAHEF